MLLQSHSGAVHLLPALPPALPSGEARGLLARGGFQVDICWRQGQLDQAVIRSAAPRPCRVRYRGRTLQVPVPAVLSASDFA